jgi:2-methylcitrate dehydratase PrpD
MIGAACAAGKSMGLDAKKIRNAIGISMYQPNYGLFAGFMGSDAKVLTTAITATTGLEAAFLAAKGLTGTSTILENENGFCENFAFAPVMSMFSGFGKTWLMDTICYKPYPGCAYVDTFVDCILKLVNENKIDPEKISEVNIYANILTYKMDGLSKQFMKGPDSTQATLNFSVPFNAAVAILDKELTPKQFTRERIRDQKIWDLAKKVNLYLNFPLTAKAIGMPPISTRTIIKEVGIRRLIPFFKEHLDMKNAKEVFKCLFRPKSHKNISSPAWKRPKIKGKFDLAQVDLTGYRMPIGNIVEIVTSDGKKFVEAKEIPLGAAGYSKEEKRSVVEAKFRREVGNFLSADKTEKALSMISQIDKADSNQIKELIKLLCSS